MTAERRVHATRAFLAAAALAGAVIVWLALGNLHPVYGRVLATLAALGLLWWCRSVVSTKRVVLWIEERVPELRYALVALLDAPDTRFRGTLEARVGRARFARPLTIAALRLVGIPLALLVVTQLLVRPVLARTGVADASRSTGGRAIGLSLGSRRDAGFSAIVVTPAYARVAPDTLRDPTSVAALVGSRVRFTGRFADTTTMPRRPAVLRLRDARGERLVALEPRLDSAPRVILELPPRDSVMPVARGTLALSAAARDDIGIVEGWFEIIVSAGSGESFKFRSAVLGRTRGRAGDARDLRWDFALNLDSLGLAPGDVVHMRAVARDANPAGDAEAGSSETRTIRIPRPDENDSLSIELAPPPEVGKSELSQRMLIVLTEKLVGQMRRMQRSAVTSESQSIGREQARLRRRVGQIIFTRLTGEEADDEHAEEALADTLSPAEALLKAAEAATGADTSHLHEEGSDAPIVAVNRPLLEAFNAMWEAERKLGVIEPRQALPHMRAALDAIQRARAAERLYLRGRAPKIVLDLARIRLSGKRDAIDPIGRAPRANAVAAKQAREARFHAALDLVAAGPESASAAVDSLVLLRVELLSERPAVAVALGAALDDLRAGRDATASLRNARRALAGAAKKVKDSRWSGS